MSRYCWNEAAFSRALRSLRCRFSTIANSAICRSSASRTCAGTCVPAGLDGGPQAALAGDQLVALADAADDHGLDHAVLANAVGQRVDLGFVEVAPRLERIAIDLVDAELRQRRRRANRIVPLRQVAACRRAIRLADLTALPSRGRADVGYFIDFSSGSKSSMFV